VIHFSWSELAINAEPPTLGLTVPRSILLRADQIIQ
jgi:hypothetical protein